MPRLQPRLLATPERLNDSGNLDAFRPLTNDALCHIMPLFERLIHDDDCQGFKSIDMLDTVASTRYTRRAWIWILRGLGRVTGVLASLTTQLTLGDHIQYNRSHQILAKLLVGHHQELRDDLRQCLWHLATMPPALRRPDGLSSLSRLINKLFIWRAEQRPYKPFVSQDLMARSFADVLSDCCAVFLFRTDDIDGLGSLQTDSNITRSRATDTCQNHTSAR